MPRHYRPTVRGSDINLSGGEAVAVLDGKARSRSEAEIQIANLALDLWVSTNGDLPLEYDGRPVMSVNSVPDADYERYGRVRNRAPRLTGPLALRGFLLANAQEDPRGERPLMVLEGHDSQLYADYLGENTSLERLTSTMVAGVVHSQDNEALGEIG
jgi:hypothetical protein